MSGIDPRRFKGDGQIAVLHQAIDHLADRLSAVGERDMRRHPDGVLGVVRKNALGVARVPMAYPHQLPVSNGAHIGIMGVAAGGSGAAACE